MLGKTIVRLFVALTLLSPVLALADPASWTNQGISWI